TERRRKPGMTGKANDDHGLTATAAADAIRRGDMTSESLVTACLDAISAHDSGLGTFAHVNRDLTLEQAREADLARRTGRGTGPLHGVPVGVKDIIDVAGMPTGYGLTTADRPPAREDAACIARLREAGAIILGKTVTTGLAMFEPAATLNPVNRAHTPGGSSSGSAAAVAAGLVPLAIGTQTAGSIIRPASYCGVYGYKPTRGLISRRGVLLQSQTLDTIGVFARTLPDLALIADAMAGYDPADAVSFHQGRSRLTEWVAAEPPLPPVLAYLPTPAFDTYANAVMADAFGELIGALMPFCIEQLETPTLAAVADAAYVVQLAENGHHYGPTIARGRDRFSDAIAKRIDAGRRVTADDYLSALAMRETAYANIEGILQDYTAILTPAAPGPAPTLDTKSTGNPIFNAVWTFLGCPCVTLPLLQTEDGLPIGVQLVGARGDDGRLLRTAAWLVQHLTNEA
ncbi:MAG: amidase, partial [Hyphomicrobiaceae bacterium]|nr:amidase [Hyphomicrobiaceae bacterium]